MSVRREDLAITPVTLTVDNEDGILRSTFFGMGRTLRSFFFNTRIAAQPVNDLGVYFPGQIWGINYNC
jgi:hypothetical protein